MEGSFAGGVDEANSSYSRNYSSADGADVADYSYGRIFSSLTIQETLPYWLGSQEADGSDSSSCQ